MVEKDGLFSMFRKLGLCVGVKIGFFQANEVAGFG
jgi:hypothetical protein